MLNAPDTVYADNIVERRVEVNDPITIQFPYPNDIVVLPEWISRKTMNIEIADEELRHHRLDHKTTADPRSHHMTLDECRTQLRITNAIRRAPSIEFMWIVAHTPSREVEPSRCRVKGKIDRLINTINRTWCALDRLHFTAYSNNVVMDHVAKYPSTTVP